MKLPSTITCAMSPFGKGVLVPLEVGQVFYLDPADGQPLADAVPAATPTADEGALSAGRSGRRGRPAIRDHRRAREDLSRGAGRPAAAPSDGHRRGQRRSVSDRFADRRHGQDRLCGDRWRPIDALRIAVARSPPAKPICLATSCGVRIASANCCSLLTANEQLVAVQADGGIAWAVTLEGGDLAGPPLAADDSVLLAYRKGILERRGLADGQPAGKLDVEHPLAAGPVRFLDRIVLTAHDGTLLVVEQP